MKLHGRETQKIKKGLVCLLTLVMVLGSFMTGWAAVDLNDSSESVPFDSNGLMPLDTPLGDYKYSGNGTSGDDVTKLFQITGPDGALFHAYCIDVQTTILNPSYYHHVNLADYPLSNVYTYPLSQDQKNRLISIVANGYKGDNLAELRAIPEIADDLSVKNAITGTQYAIWNTLHSPSIISGVTKTSVPKDAKAKALYDYLMAISYEQVMPTIGML